MDVLEQYFGGATAEPQAKPSQAQQGSVISDQLLDSLRRVESGKDRFAINKETKAMGPYQFLPETVQMLHKQGIEFNPFNEEQSRNAARSYLEQLVQKTGSVDKALAAYGGFVTKDPSGYVQNLMQGQAAPTAPQAAPAAQSSDPLESFFSGKQAPSSAPMAQSTAGAGRGSYAGFNPQEAAANVPTVQDSAGNTSIGRAAARFLGGVQAAKRDLGERVVGAIDTAYGVVPMAYGAATQAVVRPFTTPERAEQIGQQAAAAIDKPIGKALGITGSEAYQHPLGAAGTWAANQINHMFNVLGMTPEQISEKTGVPAADIRNMVTIGSFAVPQAIKEVTPTIQKVTGAVTKPFKEAAAELQVVKPGALSKAEAEAQFAAKQGQVVPGSAGAAKAQFNPYAGQITGEETARGQFPQIKLSKSAENVPVTEQATRSQIANEILGDSGSVRPGVITGNENTLRNEYTQAKMANPSPTGQLFKKQIADEQVALSNYAQKRVENTGASPTLVTPYERGERINSAFAGDDGLAGFFKNEKGNLYREATNRTGNNPIATSNVENLFADKQFRAGLGLKGNEGVAKAAEQLIELAKTTGFKDELGNIHAPNTVGAWTAVQKSLNSNWTRDNAAVIRQINQAIERDIASAGGLDLLKKADQLHQAEKTLFGSKGIKQVFGDIDPNGVQTATAFDAIPQKLNSMPTDQWRHIYDTAEKIAKGTIDGPIDKATGMPKWSIEVPEELRMSAQSAANEMRGNIAREIYQAGAAKAGEWNQNAVNKILNARADKIKIAFSPEEQAAFHKLNVGGYLMPGVHSYEGAGQQLRRVGLIEGNLERVGAATGAAAGGAIAGAPGAAIGGYLGGKAGARTAGKMEVKALQKAAAKTQSEMQKASQMGKTSLKDMIKKGQ